MEQEDNTKTNQTPVPRSVKVTSAYLVASGVLGLLFLLIAKGQSYPELAAKSFAYKMGGHTREITLCILMVVSGLGIFLRKAWARRTALFTLALVTFYGTFSFAWGFARHRPSLPVLAFSFLVVGGWNAIWLIIILKKVPRASPNQAL